MSIPRVEWRASPFYNPRDRRFPLRGDVSHRIVGSAPSALGAFGAPGGVGSSRNASSHFIIGHRNAGSDAPCGQCGTGARGPLVIYQCVDLANMAWTNGDVRDPTWAGYQAGVNPNLTTITTEHEDMASVGHHVVSDHIWRASMELKKLLRSGDLAAIRGAGIRVSDGAFSALELVRQMARLPISGATYTDHHAIAGPNKPWCWRDYDRDKGFPSRLPGLLAFLSGEDDLINDYVSKMEPIVNREAHLIALSAFRSAPIFNPKDYDQHLLAIRDFPSTMPALGWVTGTNITYSNGEVVDARKRWLVTWSSQSGIVFVHEHDVAELTPVEESTEGIPRSQYEAVLGDLSELTSKYDELADGVRNLAART